jgi:PhnB protein
MRVEPYLSFEGRCEEALEFYRSALGAQIMMMMRFSEAPDPQAAKMLPPGSEKKIMHSTFKIGDSTLHAADGRMSGKPAFQGVSLTLYAKDDAEAQRLFKELAKGGQVQMPLEKTFFASSFGSVHDRFGVQWMLMVPTQG